MRIGKRLRNGLVASSVVLGGLVGLGGCGEKTKPSIETKNETPVVALPGTNAGEKSIPQNGTETVRATDAKYLQSFEQAVIADDIPDDQQPPPDKTLAGKATGPIRAAVEKVWSQIAVADAKGEPIPFVVSLETSEGDIEITLRPELAPNHTRNLIALIKSGFYEGLCFDRIIRESFTNAEGKMQQLHVLRGGCPLGTGDPGIGHLGYFMKPEFSSSEKHEEGTFGFWHDSEPATAGCCFYITLTPAPTLDGDFTILGKVSKGLDIVKKIASQPVQNPNSDPEREKPKEPVTIKKIKVTPDSVEIPVPVAQNGSVRQTN